MNVIPAIDLRGGRCVRLFQGDFDQETEYDTDPVAVAKRFAELGCQTLHLVDLDGALTGRQANRAIATRMVNETGFDIQTGGGIRDDNAVENLLADGVTRCVIGSIAVEQPAVVGEWLSRFGPERIVLALDVRIGADGEPMLSTQGWTEDSDQSLWSCVDNYLDSGIRHVLCTDIGRDGALTGPSVDLYAEFVDRYPSLHLQASGGVRDISDLETLRTTGAASAISGRALLDGRITAAEISSFLRDA